MPQGDRTGPYGNGPIGYGMGRSAGRGMGRGMGMGPGMGLGRFAYTGTRCRRFPWLPRFWWRDEIVDDPQGPAPSAKDEKEYLKETAKALDEDLKSVQARLKDLDKK